ncbi:anti-sigma factor [Nocardia sp. NBC_00508]|uniref:ATP-binding protein n=1 Tax=Nocardia sp. NBC_00508 TaxID=2975992 RepID=UPI002E8248AC|nr:anti-sigma factor [Nocardia sp. NBC_00508]WUD67873.1 anti-sigma factor [Nocardia sp. NBC_00508]
MSKGEGTPPATTRTGAISVRVPAESEQLAMLRALAETVVLMADFGIDEVTDIRLALDEVASALVLDAVPGSELDCAFSFDGDAVDVQVCAVTRSNGTPDQAGFGWHIVTTLTDSVSASQGAHDSASGGYPTTVDFRWVRGGTDE